jgi:hypothetical protein
MDMVVDDVEDHLDAGSCSRLTAVGTRRLRRWQRGSGRKIDVCNLMTGRGRRDDGHDRGMPGRNSTASAELDKGVDDRRRGARKVPRSCISTPDVIVSPYIHFGDDRFLPRVCG